jgi:NAD(P)-dependent dehydrogenase (short-subunit alcohol dehydrogenase family)
VSGQGSGVERVALVTGASTGIGLAVARRLRRDGYALGFHTHMEDADSEARFEEASGKVPAAWIPADLSDPDAAARVVGDVLEAFGRLDVLVNNAGISPAKPVLELTAEDFDSVFAVDVRAAFLLSVAAAEPMRRQGKGAIVNITSVHELVPRPGLALYSAAKAALGMLTRSLAVELAPEIRVNAVAPGAIATERNVEAESLSDEIPLGRPGTPEEVAAAVSFLVGEEAAYVSGTTFVVDGALIQQVVSRPAG